MSHEHACGGHLQANPSVSQTLDEMEFERGIWPAAMDGELNKVSSLLRNGTNVDARDNSGYTALHYASRGGHLEICRLLLDSSASVNAQTKSGGITSLHRAAYCGHIEVVSLLLQKGARPEMCDNDGKTALHKAAEKGKPEIVKMLVAAAPGTKSVKDNRQKQPVNYVPDSKPELKAILAPS
ncbi:ankyrin repeat domain-containing protein 39-like [Lineus longissimus]|uniref:ankyrin repeat domain-containing protein 39-like n=1 Tax=Lineus longissimus TaxID=88925 RepID=UPI002B4C96F4